MFQIQNIIKVIKHFSADPKNRLLGAGILLILFLSTGYIIFEIETSRRTLFESLERESHTLAETIALSLENTMQTNNEIESLLIGSLNSVAALTSHIETHYGYAEKGLSDKSLKNKLTNELSVISKDYNIGIILITDKIGNIIVTGNSDAGKSANYKLSHNLYNETIPLYNGEYNWLDLGMHPSPIDGKSYYFLARERIDRAGAILVGFDYNKILELRKKFGLGTQLRKITRNPDVRFVILQDFDGIFAASGNIDELQPIDKDSLLHQVSENGKPQSRLNTIAGTEVYEIVMKIDVPNEDVLLLRLCMSLENLRSIHSRGINRSVITGTAMFITAAFLFAFIALRSRHLLLKSEYKKAGEHYSLLLNNITDAVLAVNSDGIITIINKSCENLLSVDSSEYIGKMYCEQFKNDNLNICRMLKSKTPEIFHNIEFTNNSGKRKIVDMGVSFIYDNNNLNYSLVAIIRDMTEQKEIEQKLRRSEKLSAMGELAAGVAHEIRNPLNAISIIAQRFVFEFVPKTDEAEFQKLAKTISSEVLRVDKIIRQFLEFARPVELNKAETDICEILDETVTLLQSRAEIEHISINKQYSKPILVFLDKDRIKQAILNIGLNAIEAMPGGGEIGIFAKNDSGKCIIEISDTGLGIAPENIEKIFNLYYTTKHGGSGIGLAIVHKIITEHGGDIKVESRKKGTSFKIIL